MTKTYFALEAKTTKTGWRGFLSNTIYGDRELALDAIRGLREDVREDFQFRIVQVTETRRIVYRTKSAERTARSHRKS